MTVGTRKRFLLLGVFFMIVTLACSNVTAQAAELSQKTHMQVYVEAMQPGWNLGNTYDATGKDETAWGNPVVTKELIDAIASSGFKSIRIPVTWNQRHGDAPEYVIDTDFLERVKQTVDWSLDAGLYVMINLHHDTSWIMKMETQHDETIGKYKAIWTQLSDYFGGYDSMLMFESINEPRFSDDWGADSDIYFTMLDELNMSFYEIIRNSPNENNKTRPLVLPTLVSSPSQARIDGLVKTIDKLNDTNIIATVHYYGYWPFSVNIAGETKFGQNSIRDVTESFDRVYKAFVEKGIPVIIGEYGLLGFDKANEVIIHSELLKYLAYVGNYAMEKGMTLMLWDNGQHFDRTNLKWIDESMYETIMLSVQSKVAQAETEYIFVRANEEILDAEIGLSLNGDELTAIKNNGEALAAGADYVVNGDKLIIYKSFIDKVLKKDYYSNVRLTCEFKNSPDWSLYICYNDTPVLNDAKKTGRDLEIETEFNGDRLITMEAKYRNGKGAGNQDWTTFKEFRSDFYPNYESGTIVLTDTLLLALDNAEITLTMHFLSGETVDYYLAKKSGQVTGGNTKEKLAEAAEEVKTDNSKKSIASMPKGVTAKEQKEEANEVVVQQQDSVQAQRSLSVVGIAAVVLGSVGVLVLAGVMIIFLKNKK